METDLEGNVLHQDEGIMSTTHHPFRVWVMLHFIVTFHYVVTSHILVTCYFMVTLHFVVTLHFIVTLYSTLW